MSHSIEILVLADRPPRSVTPLELTVPIPLLPIANKPMIDHLIEAVAAHAPARLSVVLEDGDAATAARLASAGWPDLEIFVETAARRFADRPTLALRGDMVPFPREIEAAIAEVRAHERLLCDLSRFGIFWLEAGDKIPTWRALNRQASVLDHYLPGLAAYHRLALDVERAAPDLTPGGWLESDGVRASVGARIRTRRAAGRNVSVGPYAFVDVHVMLGDDVTIGDHCYVARGVKLERAVVLPYTYVGPGLTLSRVIVGGGWAFHVDTGEIEHFDDPHLVCSLVA